MNDRGTIVPPKRPLFDNFNGIALVGQAPGETEIQKLEPFVGASGQELTAMMHVAGIMREDSYLTNVLNFKLPGNALDWVCCEKKALPPGYRLPSISKSKYLKPEYLDCLERLRVELTELKPKVVVALGNEALWALCGLTAITSYRGTVMMSTLVPGLKVLPTFHPAYVLRSWDARPLVIADLIKARAESEEFVFRRPVRELWIEPELQDLWDFHSKYIEPRPYDDPLSCDIETDRSAGHQITSMSFAPDPYHGLCIPFVDRRKDNYCYWESLEQEVQAWRFCQYLLAGPRHKLFQNGLYDIQWIWQVFKIPTKNALHDTLVAHHAMYPEMPKGLDFLASLYTREVAWKKLRPGKKEDKRDA
jgi:uracil-DNA glycosylase